MADNEIRLRTELEGCDRMIVERYKALGNKAATISLGIFRKIHVLVQRMGSESRFFPHHPTTKRNLRASLRTMLIDGMQIKFNLQEARDIFPFKKNSPLSSDFNLRKCTAKYIFNTSVTNSDENP